MSNRTFTGRTNLVAASISLAICALAGTAVAAPAGDAIDPKIAAAMERDLGITAEQLPRYFRLERETYAKEAMARRQFGDRFAGAWLERDANGEFQYVVATTGVAKAGAVPGAKVRQVRHSLRELENTFASLNAVRRQAADGYRLQGVHSWYVEPQTNRVVVKVAPGSLLRAADFVAVSAANVDAIRFEIAEGTPTLSANVIGGNAYNMSNGFTCSIGFSVTRGATKGFVTAGHCGAAGVGITIGGVSVGTMQARSFPTNDYAWANVRSTDTLFGTVNRYNGTTVPVRGRTESGLGAAVCRSGQSSGWRCGTITSLSVTVNYPQGAVFGLRQSSACTTQGDSGGSWLAGNQAQGVTSGGQLNGGSPASNCGFANPVTYYQRLNPILSAYGLTLVLG